MYSTHVEDACAVCLCVYAALASRPRQAAKLYGACLRHPDITAGSASGRRRRRSRSTSSFVHRICNANSVSSLASPPALLLSIYLDNYGCIGIFYLSHAATIVEKLLCIIWRRLAAEAKADSNSPTSLPP